MEDPIYAEWKMINTSKQFVACSSIGGKEKLEQSIIKYFSLIKFFSYYMCQLKGEQICDVN